jgi:hypothetical protein
MIHRFFRPVKGDTKQQLAKTLTRSSAGTHAHTQAHASTHSPTDLLSL